MLFSRTPILGAFVVDIEPRGDERGFFARVFCAREFGAVGIKFDLAQSNISFSALKGTLRGLHYQLAPAQEAKFVRCIRGRLWDVMLDLRQESASFGLWFGQELNAQNRRAFYVPPGVAHGFITLSDDTEISYLVNEFYAPELERGVRWNDPNFKIQWPIEPVVISERDKYHPDFNQRIQATG